MAPKYRKIELGHIDEGSDPYGATMKDDLMLLAFFDDRGDLDRYLEAEAKEMQEQNVAKVHDWLDSI